MEFVSKYDLSLTLIRNGLFDRMILNLDSLAAQKEPPGNKYFDKSLEILFQIASQKAFRIKEAMANHEIIGLLLQL